MQNITIVPVTVCENSTQTASRVQMQLMNEVAHIPRGRQDSNPEHHEWEPHSLVPTWPAPPLCMQAQMPVLELGGLHMHANSC